MEQILQMYDSDSDDEPQTAPLQVEEEANLPNVAAPVKIESVNVAPNVDTTTAMSKEKERYLDVSKKEVMDNRQSEFLFGAVQGPLKSKFETREEEFGPKKNALTGHVEIDNFDEFTFNEQYHTYQSFGYALDPSRGVSTAWYQESNVKDKNKHKRKNKGKNKMENDNENENDNGNSSNSSNSKYIGDKNALKENETMTVFNQSSEMNKSKKRKHGSRLHCNDASKIDEYLGPWAPSVKTKEEEAAYEAELRERKEEWDREHPDYEEKREAKRRRLDKEYTDKHNGVISSTSNDNRNEMRNESRNERRNDSKNDSKTMSRMARMVDTQNKNCENEADLEELRRKRESYYKEQEKMESSTYHGNEFRDYQGRTYMYCQPHRRLSTLLSQSQEARKYYLPKKRVHTWIGHKSGVNSIKFNKDGNLLLSCSNDGTCKLWNVYDNRELLRTFSGHSKGVRNICLNNDNTKFLTSSFDGWIKYWDMETGKIIWRGSSGKVPYDATFYPSNENEFLAGQKNKIAVQWDIRANKIVQIYNEHLSAVNSITFIDNNRRFVTTSDDKKIFVWDYGTPVVIKHVSDPSLHSVPFMTMHPNQKWVLGQSMDNQIVVYSADSRFRLNSKKHFKGHLSAGYACQVDVSKDGKFVMSGDAQGRIYFWDWQSSRFYGKLKCHQKVCMGCIWHPVMTSKVATCSWDGTIKLWD